MAGSSLSDSLSPVHRPDHPSSFESLGPSSEPVLKPFSWYYPGNQDFKDFQKVHLSMGESARSWSITFC